MAKASGNDMQANFAALEVDESAAGTLTFKQYAFPFSIQDKTAIIIHRIEYWPKGFGLIVDDSDYILGGLSTSKNISDPLDQSDPAIIDNMRWVNRKGGTPANQEIYPMPYIKDLANLPGGGLMVAPSPLYAMVKSVTGSSACGLWLKLFYTYKTLTTDQYWELVESRRIITSQ